MANQALYLNPKKLAPILEEDWTAIRDLGLRFSAWRPAIGAVSGLALILLTPLPNAAAVGPMGLFFMLIGAMIGGFMEMLSIRKRLALSAKRITAALEESPSVEIQAGRFRHTRQVVHRDFKLHCRWETAELLRHMTAAEAQLHELVDPGAE